MSLETLRDSVSNITDPAARTAVMTMMEMMQNMIQTQSQYSTRRAGSQHLGNTVSTEMVQVTEALTRIDLEINMLKCNKLDIGEFHAGMSTRASNADVQSRVSRQYVDTVFTKIQTQIDNLNDTIGGFIDSVSLQIRDFDSRLSVLEHSMAPASIQGPVISPPPSVPGTGALRISNVSPKQLSQSLPSKRHASKPSFSGMGRPKTAPLRPTKQPQGDFTRCILAAKQIPEPENVLEQSPSKAKSVHLSPPPSSSPPSTALRPGPVLKSTSPRSQGNNTMQLTQNNVSEHIRKPETGGVAVSKRAAN